MKKRFGSILQNQTNTQTKHEKDKRTKKIQLLNDERNTVLPADLSGQSLEYSETWHASTFADSV